MVSLSVRPHPAERLLVLRYSLSYRDVVEMMLERGVETEICSDCRVFSELWLYGFNPKGFYLLGRLPVDFSDRS